MKIFLNSQSGEFVGSDTNLPATGVRLIAVANGEYFRRRELLVARTEGARFVVVEGRALGCCSKSCGRNARRGAKITQSFVVMSKRSTEVIFSKNEPAEIRTC